MTRPQLAALYRHSRALAALLPALDAYDFSPAAAAEVQVPTMVIAGEGEPLLSQAATRLAALLPNAVLFQLPEPVSFQPGTYATLAAAVDAIERFWGLGVRD
jgi:pimeloyl-ACP methyl ester carboxylesterase